MKESAVVAVPPASAGPRAAARFTFWPRAELAFWAVPLVFFALLPAHLPLGNQVLIAGLFALSLDLALGYAGIVSLGHAAFLGVGAYTAGLLAAHGWGEPLSGLLAAGACAAAVGWVAAHLIVRGNDIARLMVTLGLAFLLYEAANKAVGITGGADGLGGIRMEPLLGMFPLALDGRVAFLYSLAVLFGVFFVCRRLVRSPFGLAMQGLRESPQRMPAIGTPVRARLVAIFTISAGIAGIAGGLLAQTTQFVGLDTLAFHRSADVLVMLIIGGVGRLYGGIIGAAVFVVAHDRLAALNPVYWQFWLGILLIVLVFAARGGVMAAAARIAQGWRA